MNKSLLHITEIAGKKTKRILGLMSGTSLDGLDIALVEVANHGMDTRVELLRFTTCDYPGEMRKRIDKVVSKEQVSLRELCLLHTRLAEYHADLILQTLMQWEIEATSIDCVASHGQTVYHAPVIHHREEGIPNTTFQIVDGDHLARRTGIPVISDFRQKHTAAGGEGAPMASLVDRMLYSTIDEKRILLNIGGIANFTYLPVRESGADIITSDTGPGNTLINAAVQHHFNREFDEDGTIAGKGTINPELAVSLKSDPFFSKPMPKTTGPELFNLDYVNRALHREEIDDIDPKDMVATLTWFTAETIADLIQSLPESTGATVYLSGGGMHNKTLVKWLKRLLNDYKFDSFSSIGFNPDAKEAVVFAVMANETLSGEGFIIKPRQGVEKRVNFGKISLPE